MRQNKHRNMYRYVLFRVFEKAAKIFSYSLVNYVKNDVSLKFKNKDSSDIDNNGEFFLDHDYSGENKPSPPPLSLSVSESLKVRLTGLYGPIFPQDNQKEFSNPSQRISINTSVAGQSIN